jgi:ribosomal protein S18 acetylase RimI-like enzyme
MAIGRGYRCGVSEIEIRPARPEDAQALGRMGATLARLHNRMDPRRFFAGRGMEEGYASWLASELASRKAIVLAAIARSRGSEQLVGYAYGRLEGRDWNTLRDPCGVGVDLYVLPRARRRGAGRLLLDALVRELVRRGAPRVVIHVAARNHRALAMFEAMGFRRTLVELAIEATEIRGESAGRPGRSARSRVS